MFHILWPEDRSVSDEQIRSWYFDACANNEAQTGFTEVKDMAFELHSIGHITLAWQLKDTR